MFEIAKYGLQKSQKLKTILITYLGFSLSMPFYGITCLQNRQTQVFIFHLILKFFTRSLIKKSQEFLQNFLSFRVRNPYYEGVVEVDHVSAKLPALPPNSIGETL